MTENWCYRQETCLVIPSKPGKLQALPFARPSSNDIRSEAMIMMVCPL